MNYETDIFLKDKGDIMTVCFQTPKALDVLLHENSDALRNVLYGDQTYKKLDVESSDDMIKFFLSYAISHSLSIDSDLPITV